MSVNVAPWPGMHDPKASLQRVAGKEHLVEVHTAHLQALNQDLPLCDQLYSTHCHPHTYIATYMLPCTTPECWPGNANLYIWVRHLGGPEGVLAIQAVLPVSCPSSSGGHPYGKNISWEKREKSCAPCRILCVLF